MKINLPLPTIILILYIVYVIFSLIMKKIKFNAENLEELDGEFIFTFIRRIRKKEIGIKTNRNIKYKSRRINKYVGTKK